MNVKAFLTNQTVLYIVLFLALTNLIGYVSLQDNQSVVFFLGVGVLTSYFSNNMVVILGVALILTNILKASDLRIASLGLEGMKGGIKEGAGHNDKDDDDEEEEEEEDEMEDEDEEEMETEDEMEDEMEDEEEMEEEEEEEKDDDGFRGFGMYEGFREANTKFEEQMIKDLKKQEKQIKKDVAKKNKEEKLAADKLKMDKDSAKAQEDKKPKKKGFSVMSALGKMVGFRNRKKEGMKGRKRVKEGAKGKKAKKVKKEGAKGKKDTEMPDGPDKKGSYVDQAATMEAAYNNLDSMIGKGGIEGLTKETQALMNQQKSMMKNMESMMPLVKQAQSMISGFDIKGLEKVANATKGGKK